MLKKDSSCPTFLFHPCVSKVSHVRIKNVLNNSFSAILKK